MATTTHWLPKRLAAWVISTGFLTAAVLIDTLSAPAASNRRISSREWIPPPTVKGMNNTLATALASLTRVKRSWTEAVMSRKTSSSAPSCS